MTYAFSLDASACSGCKACQAACKDKNHLPLGVLWRRVYEVSGGEWEQTGQAWSNTVFAYNLSLSCNHCVHPKCAGVCPVDAYTVRADGLVLLDSSKCIGCGYCAWACPYGAPQYDEAAGTMTKCNFCDDNLDLGLPPACVSACPMRVLDYVEVEKDLFNHAIGNLIDNALKYTAKGSVLVIADYALHNGKNWVIIKVQDTGIGIAKDDQKKIFEAFRQVSEGYSRNFEGCGLGLTITQKIVDIFRGEISIESEPTKGSTFSIWLPLIS